MSSRPTAYWGPIPCPGHRNMAEVMRQERQAENAAEWFEFGADEPTEAQHRIGMREGSTELLAAMQRQRRA